ncbi:phosphofructokinase-domain-containing protein [Hyaloraphidium curvatum]|nr:phosphofructokinase-domain-containing protein [Hyaloraphidium curvatum]
MNAAVRAVVRMSLARGCIPYVVFEGWQGLVDGGSKLKRVGWEDVRGIMSLGGTVIGSARSVDFRKREGRLRAAFNMVLAGIDALIVCGGDGSLTGADMLRSEWPSLIEELLSQNRITAEQAEPVKKMLTIVGLVGSIDNDMASTDITIGANTSLHRICESLDSIVSTALSHQRAFVVEVMGRHCGWLALMAAIAVAADWVFLPERPPPLTEAYSDWQTEMCESLARARKMGNKKTIVIVAEGAIDRDLKPITSDMVKKVLEERLGLDTRVTLLGHVQRGGTPSAFDRYLGTVQGAKAVDAVLESTPETPSPMIGMSNNQIIKIPLMEAVKMTHEVAAAVAKHDFARAMELRDPDFQAAYDAYVMSTIISQQIGDMPVDPERKLRVAVMHVGAPAGGMNAATRAFVRLLLNRGHTVLGIFNGFVGLSEGSMKVLSWADVNGWTTKGGSELGTNRDQPSPLATPAGLSIKSKGGSFVDIALIAYNLQKFNIQALMIVGGFEALTSVITLYQGRSIYPAFCIPIVHLPATVSNNVPGTDYSIGSDTALNAIVSACDTIKLSAAASRKRVFVVEVQGGNCGYLATLGGLATGATNCYIPEEGVNLERLQNDVKHLIRRYSEEDELGIPNEGRIILRNEGVSGSTYTTEVLSSIFHEEGRGLFDSRTATLGHVQQGGVPSPLDRIRATRMAVSCAEWVEANALASIDRRLADLTSSSKGGPSAKLQSVYCPQPETAAVIGIRGAEVVFTPIETLMAETDLVKRKALEKPWWLDLQHLTR